MFTVFTGKRGAGKSYGAVGEIHKTLGRGKKVWVNFPVDFRKHFPKLPHDKCRIFNDLDDLAYMRDGLMVMDEVHWQLSSRDWKSLKNSTHQYIAQSRKLHMDLILISQNFNRLDAIARELTEVVREHHSFGGNEKKKRPPLFLWYKEYTPEDVGKAKRKNIKFKLLRFNKKMGESYDTDQYFGALLESLPPKEFPISSFDYKLEAETKKVEQPPPLIIKTKSPFKY